MLYLNLYIPGVKYNELSINTMHAIFTYFLY